MKDEFLKKEKKNSTIKKAPIWRIGTGYNDGCFIYEKHKVFD